MRRNELVLFLIGSLLLITPASATVISIEHSTNSFDVVCTPTEPIKAFEFTLSYDPTIIEVDYAEMGDFFYPYATFSFLHALPGSIVAYALLMGNSSLINETGTLIHVEYTPIGFGVTDLTFSDSGVTDNSSYVPSEWIDSTLTFEALNSNYSNEGYFLFKNTAHNMQIGDDVAPRYFYFFNMATRKNLVQGAFSFGNNSTSKIIQNGYFTFQCPPESPVNDIGNALGNNINLITFVVLVTVITVALVWLGLRWQRRRQML